jgi:hypothetical protein
MPSEKAFLRQAELAREALDTFLAVRDKPSPNIVKLALADLIDTTVRIFLLYL